MSSYDEQKKAYDTWIASDMNVELTTNFIDMVKKTLPASEKLGSEESVAKKIAEYEHILAMIIVKLGMIGVADSMEEYPKDFDMTKCMSAWMAATWDKYNQRKDREFLIFSENDFYSYLNSLDKKSTETKEKPEGAKKKIVVEKDIDLKYTDVKYTKSIIKI